MCCFVLDCLSDFSALQTDAGRLPQTSVSAYQTMRRHIARETSHVIKIIAKVIS